MRVLRVIHLWAGGAHGSAQSRPPVGAAILSWGSNGVMCGQVVISGTISLVTEEVELASAQGRELAVHHDVVFPLAAQRRWRAVVV
ncbi:hypothetical protein, partial [Arthrobacter sp. H5]|uniref:hypothetical protein n=1 Tax=Arthrobacter sp. H5 TaxID=1267973 RepID=UPI001C1E3712